MKSDNELASINFSLFYRIIDDPLEAFNRIMREKEMRKDRYRRSPKHGDRRSRSFERKRSPMGQYSPDSRRQKNYNVKARKRSRSFKSNSSKSYSRSRSRSRNRSTRGRSKSRSYSPRYEIHLSVIID
jgi:E3 ubiquitin-protein ligase RBBP6